MQELLVITKKESNRKYKKSSIRKLIYFDCLLLILLLIIYLVYSYFSSKEITDKYTNLLDNTYVEEVEDEVQTTRMLQVQELNKNNEDIIGWIEINDTVINYPLLHGDDNYYYLSRDYEKNEDANGSIFLDKNYDFSIPSSNLLVYGHNKTNGTMFEDLLKYEDYEFYETHEAIRITTQTSDDFYEIIGVFKSRVYAKDEVNVFRYYNFINADNEDEYNEYVENVLDSSLYDTNKTAEYGDQLLTLSTCEYSQENGRFVVVAKKIPES